MRLIPGCLRTLTCRAPFAALVLLALGTLSKKAGAQVHTGHAMTNDSKPDMMMTGPLGITTDRQGSGTSWVPEAIVMPFRHALLGRWDVMSHWNVFLQADMQGGTRGRTQFGSINWSMVMASRPFLGGRLQLRAMNSVDPITVGRCGYPHLLQSGETCHGAPNADRQHPHDFFMETAALFERGISRSLAWSLYVAPSGEPASGPAAFMHRPSAMNDPFSNITHHWQDATHITFGVVTGAVYGRSWKLEGSAFNAREPDEHRWNFDLKNAPLKSASGRLTLQPTSRWSATASYAYLHRPDPAEPEQSMHRATASVLHGRSFGEHGKLATAVVWGANRHDAHWENSGLAEANIDFMRMNSVFARVEHVRKGSDELALAPALSAGNYPVTGLTLGYVRELGAIGVHAGGLGLRATMTIVPDALGTVYGSSAPKGLVVFLRLRPKAMTSEELAAMHEKMRRAGMKMN